MRSVNASSTVWLGSSRKPAKAVQKMSKFHYIVRQSNQLT